MINSCMNLVRYKKILSIQFINRIGMVIALCVWEYFKIKIVCYKENCNDE